MFSCLQFTNICSAGELGSLIPHYDEFVLCFENKYLDLVFAKALGYFLKLGGSFGPQIRRKISKPK